jgi:hypothetical protein
MAEEGTLGIARAGEYSSTEDLSKEHLQRRMDEARESISHTVTEIKDSVVHQYEAVKDTISETLDWREQFKKRPVAWSVGAAGAGFLTGYCLTSMVKGDDRDGYAEGYERARQDYQQTRQRYAAKPAAAGFVAAETAEEHAGPGLLTRIQETPAYERVKSEASNLGGRLVDEVSKSAQDILLPAAIGWVRHWLEGLIPQKGTSMRSQAPNAFANANASTREPRTGYQPVKD